MFPSNTSNNSYNRNYYEPSFPFFSFDFENNPKISKQQPNSPFNFHHFPSIPFHDFHQNIFHEQTQNDFDLFQIQHQYSNDLHLPIDMEMDVSIKTKGNIKVPNNTTTTTTNKRSRSRKDRHSKIETARGMRDRRMRLSLQVAKRFFHLQDMLGFAKASKTVEWLLNQSKNQINQIEAAASSKSNVSSSTNFELLSSPEEVVVNENHQEHKRKKPLSVIKTKNCRKIVRHPLAKVLREKARERARERTREKRSRRSNQSEVEEAKGTIHKFTQLGSWNTQFGDESSGTQISQTLNPSCDFVTETNDLSSFSFSEEHLGTLNEDMIHIDHSSLPILSTSNTSMIFSSQNHSRVLLQ